MTTSDMDEGAGPVRDDRTGDSNAPEVGQVVAAAPSASQRLHDRYARGRAAYESKFRELQYRRADSNEIDAVFRVAESDTQRGGGLLAGGVAFRGIVLLIPLVFVVVTALAAIGATFDPSDPQSAADAFGIVGLAGLSVQAATDLPLWQLIVTLVGGMGVVIYETYMMIRSVRVVHGLAWDELPLRPVTRPWVPTLWTLAGLAGLVLLSGLGYRIGEAAGFGAELIVRVLAFFVFVGGWVFVSAWLPHPEGATWRDFVPGALLFGIGAEILQLVTVYYFAPELNSKTSTYGAIGASLVILLWAYFLGRLILSSAFLNAARWSQTDHGDAVPS